MRSTALSLVAALGLLVPGVLHAQTGAVEGRVVNAETGEALADVQVSLLDTELGTISADDGTFRIEGVPAGGHTPRRPSSSARSRSSDGGADSWRSGPRRP